MARNVRCALIQANCTSDKQANIDKHVKYIEEAVAQGAKVVCLQEIFSTAYFCQIQDKKWYETAETIPGPTTNLMCEIAKQHGIVIIVPIYESVGIGTYYNTAAIIDADGRMLGIYRKTHIPNLPGFWEKMYFKPGNLGYPVFQTQFAKIGAYICYDRHFPEGARLLGLHGAEIVFIPSATARSLSMHLWDVEQRSHAIANGYFVGTNNRVGVEPEFGPQEYYGSSYFCDPRGTYLARASDKDEQVLVADLDLDLIREVRDTWQFYRDRRPDMYSDMVAQLP